MPINTLNFLWISRQLEGFYCFNLIGVDFYSSVSDQIPQELTIPYSESILIGIEAQLVPSK